MKRAVLIGGPMDGCVRTVDDRLTVLYACVPPKRPVPLAVPLRVEVPPPLQKVQYREVLIGEQQPVRLFKLSILSDDQVLQKLLDHYAAMHEERGCPCPPSQR